MMLSLYSSGKYCLSDFEGLHPNLNMVMDFSIHNNLIYNDHIKSSKFKKFESLSI